MTVVHRKSEQVQAHEDAQRAAQLEDDIVRASGGARHAPTLTAVDMEATGANRLPEDSYARKQIPLCTGLIDYFPNALAAVAALSKFGNDKHNPGEALNWARGKSNDHADCIARHLIDRGGHDAEGNRHSVMLAWRALALAEEELEAALGLPPSRGSR